MKIRPRAGVTVVLAIAACVALDAQQSVAPRNVGIIAGQVIDGDTGRPVAKAVVDVPLSLEDIVPRPQAGGETSRRALTNADGRFVLRDLPFRRHLVRASAPGYLGGASGVTRPGTPFGGVEISDVRPYATVTIRMWKTASFTGTVFDETGAPAVGVVVQAIRMTSPRTAVPMEPMTTDDRGMYRFADLMPDEYLVAAPVTITNVPTTTADEYRSAQSDRAMALRRQLSASGLPEVSWIGITVGDQRLHTSEYPPAVIADGRRVLGYSTTFHPSADEPSAATRIRLASGDERTGVDLTRRLVPLTRVSGLVDGPGGPLAHAAVTLVNLAHANLPPGFETAVTTSDAVGRFTLIGVPPGRYRVEVARVPASSEVGSEYLADVTQPTLWARTDLTVAESPIDDLRIRAAEGFRISGRVAFTGSTPPPAAARVSAMLASATPVQERRNVRPATGPGSVRLDANGRFTTPQYIPGTYRVSLTRLSAPWVLASVRHSDRDLLVDALDLSTADIEDVVVTYHDQPTEISGSVQTAGRTADDVVVFLFPAEVERWLAGGRYFSRTRLVRPDARGAFRLRDLPIGDYCIVALPADRSADASEDDAFVRRLAAGATKTSLAAGEQRTVTLTVDHRR